jgi:hypothetical protein
MILRSNEIDQQESILLDRMINILLQDAQRVAKYSRRLKERDSMLT